MWSAVEEGPVYALAGASGVTRCCIESMDEYV
jgi:hypothetical protein